MDQQIAKAEAGVPGDYFGHPAYMRIGFAQKANGFNEALTRMATVHRKPIMDEPTPAQLQLIGLLGGMSWESSALYYRFLNEAVHRELGGHHNARSVLFTIDFHELNAAASAGRWDRIAEVIADAGKRVERAGADFVMITAVTGHAVADRVAAALTVPLLHIADPVAETLKQSGMDRIGLLGTRYTMEMDFLRERLARHGLDVLVPDTAQREALHTIIIDELTLGRIEERSQEKVASIAESLAARGAQAVIAACTELPLLMPMTAYPIPAFDVPRLHAEAAVRRALGAVVE